MAEPASALLPISGYVLAGGRSSRMGSDKALLTLAGRPLIAHAVAKLRGVCADVHILGAAPALAAYAPMVADLHPGCGPVGGVEAALAHSAHDWNLLLAVDMPFLPAAILYRWAARTVESGGTARVAMFSADGRAQPAVCLLHKDIAPSIGAAVALEEYGLLPVLEAAANVLALQQGRTLEEVLSIGLTPSEFLTELSGGPLLSSAQQAAQPLWFLNLNTPQDLAMAEANIAVLDS